MKLSNAERINWLRLARSENIGQITFFRLLSRYGTAYESLKQIEQLAIRGGRAKSIKVASIADAESELSRLAAIGGEMIMAIESDYPKPLAAITNRPPVLTILGKNKDLLQKPSVAVVGSRNASAGGVILAREISKELSSSGIVVVSGLARGIDTIAHQAALAGGTIAVVAGGIDQIYPPENKGLRQEIIETGLVIAEAPLGVAPQARFFPERNRIVSGLSIGVVVVEAAMGSGSLITARLAGEHGREVWSVPGSPLDPRSAGTNQLIKDGANIVRNPRDVVDDVNNIIRQNLFSEDSYNQADNFVPITFKLDSQIEITDQMRSKVLALLSSAPITIEQLIEISGISAEGVNIILLESEIAGKVIFTGDYKVIRLP